LPSYDDQLAAYRSQLASISSMQAQTASNVPGTGAMSTAGLAFNTMMSDMSRAASYVSTFSVTPSSSSIPISRGSSYSMGFGQALGALAGFSMPPSPMYVSDYQYLANERVARGVGGAATSLLTGSMEFGGGILGGMALGAAGGAIGGSIVPGVGTAIGAVVGGLAGGFLGASAMTPIGAPAIQIASAAQQLQLSTPAVFGGMGMTREVSRSLARDLSRQAIGKSEGWLASPGEEMNLTNMAISQGTKFGLFSGTTDTASFAKELGELTTTIKEMSRAIRVSKEEMVPILAEMRQGGFYGAKAGGQAILQGSGLAYGAGVGFQEMHEAGLRGAAMFRGTGIPTAIGYQTGEANLFNVRRLQQKGLLGQETINQLGGITGAAESLTAGTAGFVQGPIGRHVAAALMQGRGGVNMNALQSLAGGASVGDLLSQANIDPMALSNPEVVEQFWATMGPGGIQAAQAAVLQGQTKFFEKQGFGEDAFSMAFRQNARSMGIVPNTANQKIWKALSENAAQLAQDQQNNFVNEGRRLETERGQREGDIWGRSGVRGASRAVRGGLQPIGERINTIGEFASDVTREIGDWWNGTRRVSPQSSDSFVKALSYVNLNERSPFVERTKGVLTKSDYMMMKGEGLADKGSDYAYSPTGWFEGKGEGVSFGAYDQHLKNVDMMRTAVDTKVEGVDEDFRNFYTGAWMKNAGPQLDYLTNTLGGKYAGWANEQEAIGSYTGRMRRIVSEYKSTEGGKRSKKTDAEIAAQVLSYEVSSGTQATIKDKLLSAGTSSQTYTSSDLEYRAKRASLREGNFFETSFGIHLDYGSKLTSTLKKNELDEALRDPETYDLMLKATEGKVSRQALQEHFTKKGFASSSLSTAGFEKMISDPKALAELQGRITEEKGAFSERKMVSALQNDMQLKALVSNLKRETTGMDDPKTGEMVANLDALTTGQNYHAAAAKVKELAEGWTPEQGKEIVNQLRGDLLQRVAGRAGISATTELSNESARQEASVVGYRRVPGTNQQTDINGQTLLALRQINSELKARGASNTPGAPTTGATNNKGPG